MFDNICIWKCIEKTNLSETNFGHFCIQRASLHWRICRQTWQTWLTCLYLQSLLSNVLDMDDDFRSTTLPTVTAPVHHPSHVAGHQNAGFVRWVSCHVMSCHVLCVMLLLLCHVICVMSLLMCHVICVTSCLMCHVICVMLLLMCNAICVTSCHVMSCHILCVMLSVSLHVTSCHVSPYVSCYLCHVTSYVSCYLSVSRHVARVIRMRVVCPPGSRAQGRISPGQQGGIFLQI